MTREEIPPPSVEERLCCAAFTILTDGNRHSLQARTWAVRCLRRSTPSGRTVFTRQATQWLEAQQRSVR